MNNNVNTTKKRPVLGTTLVVLAAVLTALGGGLNGKALTMGVAAVVIIGFDLLLGGGAGIAWTSWNSRNGSKDPSSWRELACGWHAVSVALLVVATLAFKLMFIWAQQLIPIGIVASLYYGTQSLPSLADGLKVAKAAEGPRQKVVQGAKAFISPLIALGAIALFAEPWSGHHANALGLGLAICAGLGRVAYFMVTDHRFVEDDSSDPESGTLTPPAKKKRKNQPLIRKAAALANLLAGFGALAVVSCFWGNEFIALGSLPVLGLLLVIGIISSTIPSELQLRGQAMTSAREFSIVRSIAPVFAALVGVVVLGQMLDVYQWAAVGVSTLALVAGKLLKTELPSSRPDEAETTTVRR